MSSHGNSVAEVEIKRQLEEVAVVAASVDVSTVDNSSQTALVTVISDDFEGQTYLDREQRIRPVVLRALLASGMSKPNFVLDLQTPSEWADTTEPPSGDHGIQEQDTSEDRIGKARWRTECDRILRALKESDYVLTELLSSRVFIASRQRLAVERILVAFAESPRLQTVHTEALRVMRTARQSQSIAAAYYISPSELSAPYSGQKPAPWLTLKTGKEFVHHLAGSNSIAATLVEECKETEEQAALGGKCIEPEAVNAERETIPHVFKYVEDWAKRDRASVLIIVADAGHGKTTLTNELTRRQAEAFLNREADQLPLSVPFESVRRMVDFTALLHLRLSQLRGHAYGAFIELLRMGRATLYIDGFDELADDAGLTVAEAQVRSIRGLLAEKAKIVLAGRTAFASIFAGQGPIKRRFQMLLGPDVDVELLELQPFDRNQVSDYLESRKTLTQEARSAVMDFVNQSPDHEQLCANPLFLRMLCSLSDPLAIKRERAENGIASLLEGVCKREEQRQHLSISVPGQLSFLGMVAQDMFFQGKTRLPSADIAVHAELLAEDLHHSAPGELAHRLTSHALLTTSSGNCSFIHPFIRDVILALTILTKQQAGDHAAVPSLAKLEDRECVHRRHQEMACLT